MSNPILSIEETVRRLRSKGHKITPQRLEVIRIISEIGNKHPSIREIYEIVSKKIPTVSFSTLYLIIQTLEEEALVKTFTLNKETHIEINLKPHINLISLETGEIRDLVDENVIEAIKEAIKKIGKEDHEIHFINIYIK